MKIAVIGPGALGCLLAATLSRKFGQTVAGALSMHDIWLLDYRAERALLLNRQGIYLTENGRQDLVPVKVTSAASDVGTADLIFLCVKSGDVETSLAEAQAIAGQSSLLITMQNGIGHLIQLREYKGPPAVAVGVTAQGANLYAPGKVRHAGTGITRIGTLTKPSDSTQHQLVHAAALLNAAGLETVVEGTILNYVWAKLMVNVGINALTAIYDCPNGGLLEKPDARRKMAAAVREAQAVAEAQGIGFTSDPLDVTEEVCRKTAKNISSMLQDVRQQRLTEIDSINGAVVRIARKLDIAVPVNEELVAAVKKIEQGAQSHDEK